MTHVVRFVFFGQQVGGICSCDWETPTWRASQAWVRRDHATHVDEEKE